MRNRWLAASLLAVAVVALAACGSSTTSAPPAATGGGGSTSGAGTGSGGTTSSAAGLKTASTSVGTILETASGMAIYWFANDTPAASNCSGTCLSYWPPVIGTPSAASGVTLSGQLGTIKRSDGQLQATYMDHPLYTYVSDSPGKVTGNGINTSGGLWWAMTPSGAKASSSGSSGSGGSGGGGYGY
jgi:predicted lipoprotein with Yx(FWY)xxD motif